MDSTLLNDSSALGTLRDVLLIKTVCVLCAAFRTGIRVAVGRTDRRKEEVIR